MTEEDTRAPGAPAPDGELEALAALASDEGTHEVSDPDPETLTNEIPPLPAEPQDDPVPTGAAEGHTDPEGTPQPGPEDTAPIDHIELAALMTDEGPDQTMPFTPVAAPVQPTRPSVTERISGAAQGTGSLAWGSRTDVGCVRDHNEDSFVIRFPLFAVAAWEVWRGRERSLLSGLATTAAASLMSAVTYSLAVGGAGGFLGTGGASGLPGSSPNGALTGWAWMWVVTASTAAYFCGTVPYIKSMIRERFNYVLLAGTVAAHALVAVVTWWLASSGMLPWGHAVLWVVLTVRSLVMPLWQWQLVRTRHRPLRPGTMGIVEVFMCVAFLVTISV